MKYLLDIVKLIPALADSKLIWAFFVVHYGIRFIAIVLYLHDWIIKGGLRSDLLLLIEKL